MNGGAQRTDHSAGPKALSLSFSIEMPVTKRRALTTDDLMRRQEEPVRKKLRRTPITELHEDGSSTGDSSTGSRASFDGHETGEEDLGDEIGSHDGSEDISEREQTFGTLSEHERFSSSRVQSSKPCLPIKSNAPLKEQPSSFLSLGVSNDLQAALSAMSIRTPTEVQAACIPPILAGEHSIFISVPAPHAHPYIRMKGRDCIGNAKTGSGKTVAFAVPILQKLSIDPYGIFALVLTPTRFRIHFKIQRCMLIP